jgi:hypothetical protein
MSYVVLDIDTSNPIISIYAPSYTTPDILNLITVEASEPLDVYQDIYVIDSENVRHDYTFFKEDDNTYIGKIRFNNLPVGVHTMYARVRDEVYNYSNTAMTTFEIKESLSKGNVEIANRAFNIVSVSNHVKEKVVVSDRAFSTDSRVTVSDYKMANAKAKDYKKYEVIVNDREHGDVSNR